MKQRERSFREKNNAFFMIRTKKIYHKDTFYINRMNIFPQLNLYQKKLHENIKYNRKHSTLIREYT